jgi:hypothetical protein
MSCGNGAYGSGSSGLQGLEGAASVCEGEGEGKGEGKGEEPEMSHGCLYQGATRAAGDAPGRGLGSKEQQISADGRG